MGSDTRERIIEAALKLFGERGFAATSISQIERESGLSAGSGGLYRHFSSKKELLTESVRARLTDRSEWEAFLAPEFSITAMMESLAPGGSITDTLVTLCHIGMARLDHDRDINRLLLRDNSVDPDVLEIFRRDEYELITSVVTKSLVELSSGAQEDWRSAAAVVVGAIVHYWLVTDIFGGTHPLAIDADSYMRATAELVAARIETTRTPRGTE